MPAAAGLCEFYQQNLFRPTTHDKFSDPGHKFSDFLPKVFWPMSFWAIDTVFIKILLVGFVH